MIRRFIMWVLGVEHDCLAVMRDGAPGTAWVLVSAEKRTQWKLEDGTIIYSEKPISRKQAYNIRCAATQPTNRPIV